MNIQEILEAHKHYHAYVADDYSVGATCTCGEEILRRGMLSDGSHRAHVAEVLEKHMQEREATAWHEAKNAIRNIPCWFKDWDHHGFDLWTDENGYAQETGARIEVMRVLRNNPYLDKEPTNGR